MAGVGSTESGGYDGSYNLNYAELETEVRLLREQLADEKLKREQNFFDQHQLFT